MLKGIEVTEDSLSLDVIDDVCKGPGHFLGHAQTLALMNSEYLYPGLLDRDSRDEWERKGARDIREAARERARKVLAENWPEVIPGALEAANRRSRTRDREGKEWEVSLDLGGGWTSINNIRREKTRNRSDT